MGLLRGKKDKAGQRPDPDEAAAGELGALDAVEEPATGADDGPGADAATSNPRRRPLDESEAADDSTMPRLDLGSLRVPVLPDMEVRVELNEQQQPVAATVLHGGAAVQILGFAAPRNDGIWDDVRSEIAESVRKDGGQVDEVDGAFGPELRVRVRGEVKPGQVGEQRLRFVGFDGPRWFVRGVFSGPAATNPQQAAALEAILTSVVVVRGTDPMAPRDPLPLRLPTDVAGIPQPAPEQQPSIDPLTRGPEITETR